MSKPEVIMLGLPMEVAAGHVVEIFIDRKPYFCQPIVVRDIQALWRNLPLRQDRETQAIVLDIVEITGI